MTKKRNTIPAYLRDILPAVAILALIAAICIVGVLILNSGSKEQLANNPTDAPTNAPTDAPTEPPTEPPTETPADPLQELKDKAAQYLKQNVKNSEKYTLIKFILDDDTEIYSAYFTYLIYGYPTQDRCYVKMQPDGTLISVEQYDEGTMDGMPITEEVLQVADYELFTINSLNKATTTVAEKCICYTTAWGLYVQYEVFTDGNDLPVSYKVLLWQQPERPLDPNDQPHVPDVTVTVETALSYMSQYVSDVTRYTLYEFSYSPDGLYTAIFYHQICGVNTMDLCIVIIREDGSLYNCVVDNEKAFDRIPITDKMLQQAMDNMYGINCLPRDEWTAEYDIIQWKDDKLFVTIRATNADGTTTKSYDVRLNWNLPKPDDKTAIDCALKYMGLNGHILQAYDSVYDNSTDSAHYDVTVQVNGIRYACEVHVSDGSVSNIRSEKVS